MTALTMSVKHRHPELIRRGTKTHTLRMAREGQYAGKYRRKDGEWVDAAFNAGGSVKWYVGCRRAIKKKRSGPAVCYVEIAGVREMMLCEVDDAMALLEGIQKEDGVHWGFWDQDVWLIGLLDATPRDAFEALWDSIHGNGAFAQNPRVFGLRFRYAGEG